ncbi:NAD-dependent 4,6-dehydratase LegB [Mucilaginibacter sp. L3T2-6]|uniref:NAD-dependent 4,6-dehydratase LegB n=1 Tax=Mucilaginibacter sp. L3T2-6 TaxID=3062491 RepID=UPI002676907D|nr:NAD-dependent 4,6-dehydratase LegB [Mucilaginibacter sp. L3T2-6]MDO3642482.1 NAD-dependent 4,6-dehydratase LegB [Mucilaginibacter sp. L3T2-6]MDV6215122.1 NAD-dependent 4,6-dehydratase LegB [Mucilaginibacter sp. L3T2-6]
MDLREKSVLITGADGFIGSHLVENLIEEGCRVKAFVYYNSFNSWGWLDSLPKNVLANVEIFAGDIRDPNGVREAVKGTDIIFHLAALIAIPFSYHSPDSYIDTNVKGTLNIVQAARDLGIQRILVTSTSEVYGTAQYIPIDESHPRQPQSPYSASKIGADCIAESFYRSFNLPLTIVRPFNTYGPRQSARAVIPTIITQLLNGTLEVKLGETIPTRDLLFVKDTVRGFAEIAKSDSLIGHDCNIATQSEISIGDLAQELINQLNPHARILTDTQRLRPEKSEVFRLYGSNQKLQENTNWKPSYTLEQGLAETIKWFSDASNLSRYKADIYNI